MVQFDVIMDFQETTFTAVTGKDMGMHWYDLTSDLWMGSFL